MLLGVIYVAISSLAWATFDATRKSLTDTVRPLPLAGAVIIFQAPIFFVWHMVGGETFELTGPYLKPAIASVVLNIFANYLFLLALRISPFSLTIPFLSFAPVFAALIEWLALGESLVPWQWVGIGIVVVGAFVLQLSGFDKGESIGQALVRERGPLYVFIVAAIWATTSVLDKMAVDYAPEPAHGLFQTGFVGLGLVIIAIVTGQASEWNKLRDRVGTFTLAVGSAIVALGIQLLAYKYIYVSIVEATKRAVGLSAALVIGRLQFGERISPMKVFAVLALYAGVALILLTGSSGGS